MSCRYSVLASLAAAVLAAAQVLASENTSSPRTGQGAPSRDGAISGVVVDGSTGAPVADAIVAVASRTGAPLPSGPPARQATDAKGRFAFLNLPSDGAF